MLVVARKCTPTLVLAPVQSFKQPNRTHTIRRFGVALLAGIVFSAAASGSPAVAQKNATQVIEASMNAMGGRSHLNGLHSLKLDLRTVAYRIDDSEQEDGAPWLNIDVATEWRDEDAGRSRVENDDASAQWVIAKMVKIDDGHALASASYRNGNWRWSAQPSFGERLALSPEHILFTAAAASDLKLEPDDTVNGEPQDVLSFTWKGFPTRLYVDKTLHLPTRVEQRRASPLDRASVMLGDVVWRTDFLFYKPEVGGLVYPHQWNLYRDGKAYSTTVVLKLEENPAAPASGYAVPTDANLDLQQSGTFAYADLPIPTPKSGDPLQPLGDNVWEIAGAWNVLVVKQADGLVVIECPQSGAYSERVIALLSERFAGVRIKALVSTTDSLWHITGVRPYVARGTPIYVLDQNSARLAQFIARPHTVMPDALSKSPRAPELRPVTDRTVIGGGPSRIELYPIRGHGDARMMMVFLPELGLLYGSSNDAGSGGMASTFNAFELVSRVDGLGLPVKDYIAIHTEKMSWVNFRAIVAEKPVIHAD
jgi:hypothetical protein